MQTVLARSWIAGLLAVALIAFSSTAQFQAPSPGALLEPLGSAANVIRLTQGQTSILWTSTGVDVEAYRVQGWPSDDGTHELGGGLRINAVDGSAGVIQFGERPMSLEFSLRD